MVDIDGAHLDPVLAHIADDLRCGIEPHRLAVEQGAGKDYGIEAFTSRPGSNARRAQQGAAAAFARPGPPPHEDEYFSMISTIYLMMRSARRACPRLELGACL